MGCTGSKNGQANGGPKPIAGSPSKSPQASPAKGEDNGEFSRIKAIKDDDLKKHKP